MTATRVIARRVASHVMRLLLRSGQDAIVKPTAGRGESWGKSMVRLRYPPASRPGEPPRRRTGRLKRGIRARPDRMQRSSRMGVRGTIDITSRAPYGKYLEWGTRKMAARPWARPIIRRMRQRSLRKTLQRASRRIRQ